MTDAPSRALLQEIVRRESRSLLQYVSESFPWTAQAGAARSVRLAKMIEEERQATANLARFLIRRRIELPYLGAYPMAFTHINYVSLDHLLPLLVDHEKRAIEQLERDLTCLFDVADREQVQQILDMKRGHVVELEKMLPEASPSVVSR